MYKQFGVREICNVVFKANTKRTIGTKSFEKGQPVIYFDSLKTSSLEGASTTVYAQGGRGNPRLIAWEGERTVTFTMEDALISPMGFAILSGAGLIQGTADTGVTHVTQRIVATTTELDGADPVTGNADYPMYALTFNGDTMVGSQAVADFDAAKKIFEDNKDVDAVLLDYYVAAGTKLTQIDIEPDKFGGNFYIEAETLFRDKDGADHAAEFIIPNGKVQSNFTFTMASSGDPSTFTFTVDAFPGYTKFDKSKKVMATLQIIDETTVDTTTQAEPKE
jgi:hypothetical protein